MGSSVIRRWGYIIIFTSIILETIIFFSEENLLGCLMAIICWYLFQSIGLNTETIQKHPFVWFVFLSMTLYRVLALPATLLELKPISYHFECAKETFMYETLAYFCCFITFYIYIKYNNKPRFLKRTLTNWGFYRLYDKNVIWTIGIIGVLVELCFFIAGNSLKLDLVGKLLSPLRSLSYFPLVLFFPVLWSNSSKIFRPNLRLWLFLWLLIIIPFTANSRHLLIYPFATFALLFFLAIIKSNTSYKRYYNAKTIIIGLSFVLLIMPVLSFISDVMLANRGVRNELSRSELFERQMETFSSGEIDENKLRADEKDVESYSQGWTEMYLNNFALNRFCNLRVTDITLYHAKRIGFNNLLMQADFINTALSSFPNPLLKFFRVDVSKQGELISRADYLLRLSFNKMDYQRSLRVTSHVSDGLATFGWWYFPLQIVIFYVFFILIDTYGFKYKGIYHYSLYGMGYIFGIFEQVRNANGSVSELGFIFRGYLQSIIIFMIVIWLAKLFAIQTKTQKI